MRFKAFYSDPHFGHANIIRFDNRPYADLTEMHREMIARYNAVVGPQDPVLWVGDVYFKISPRRAAEILRKMNGIKFLVQGNHDKSVEKMCHHLGFLSMTEQLRIFIGGRNATVCHFPYAGTNHASLGVDDRFSDKRPVHKKGEVLIHGHMHSPRQRKDNMINVAVTAWDYRPATWGEVEALVQKI